MIKCKMCLKFEDGFVLEPYSMVYVKYNAEDVREVIGRCISFDEHTITLDVSEQYKKKEERIAISSIIDIYDYDDFAEEDF